MYVEFVSGSSFKSNQSVLTSVVVIENKIDIGSFLSYASRLESEANKFLHTSVIILWSRIHSKNEGDREMRAAIRGIIARSGKTRGCECRMCKFE